MIVTRFGFNRNSVSQCKRYMNLDGISFKKVAVILYFSSNIPISSLFTSLNIEADCFLNVPFIVKKRQFPFFWFPLKRRLKDELLFGVSLCFSFGQRESSGNEKTDSWSEYDSDEQVFAEISKKNIFSFMLINRAFAFFF